MKLPEPRIAAFAARKAGLPNAWLAVLPWTDAEKEGHGDAGDIRASGRVRQFVRDRHIYGDGDRADHIFKVETGAMTRKDIADYLGLTIETVSRTFSHLEQKAFIELIGARQVCLRDTAGLRDLCA